jgi:hypothetical protein
MGYRRMLFVGLGGSGGKALRFLKRDFTDWCRLNGWFDEKRLDRVERDRKGDLPFGVQFINIDTPAIQDGRIAGAPLLADREYRGLVSKGLTMKSLIHQVDMSDRSGASLAGWRVSPLTRVKLEDGAGQFRAVGRSVSRAFATPVHDALKKALTAVDSSRAKEEMLELDNIVHGTRSAAVADDLTAKNPITVFISSLAGGTGAGLISDALDIYRSLEPTYHEDTLGIWFTPDAFPPSYGPGLRPNAMAAISEILNGAWWFPSKSTSVPTVEVPVRDTDALESTVGLPNTIEGSGAYLNYLVGQTNIDGEKLDTDARLFEKVGGALLSWIVDQDLQEHLSKVWENLAAKRERERIDLPWSYGTTGASPGASGPPVFDALGFSRVSLGTRYFGQYSVERLTRRVVEHLGRAHIDSEWAIAERLEVGLSNDSQIIDAMSRRRYPKMRAILDVDHELDAQQIRALETNHRLDEESEEALGEKLVNLIEKALVPYALVRRRDTQIQELITHAESHPEMTIGGWAEIFVPIIDREVRDTLIGVVEEQLPGRIEDWAAKVAQNTVMHAEEAVGDFGLTVASGMLDLFSLEIRDVLIPALEEMEDASRRTSSRSEVYSVFAGALGFEFADSQKFAADEIGPALTQAARAVAFDAVARVLSDARILAERYRKDVLRPLIMQIGEAASRIDINYRENVLNKYPVDSDTAEPPKHLLPPKSESTVIENAEFGLIFSDLMRKTYRTEGEEVSASESTNRAVRDLASGSFAREKLEKGNMSVDDPFRGDFERAQLISVERRWKVGSDLSSDRADESPAKFNVRADVADVLDRTNVWVKRRNYPFGDFIEMDLRTFSEGDPERQQRVLAKLQEAVATARPLVQLFTDTIGTLYPEHMLTESKRVRFSITKVPFKSSEIEGKVHDLLRSRVFANEDSEEEQAEKVDRVLSESADLPYIDIVSWLATPVSPIAVETLVKPLVESWTQAKDDASAGKEYWEMRRVRPLGEFVPLPQAQLIAALRGWFTGRLLGLIDVDVNKPSYRILGGSESIDPRWYDFPNHLLSPFSPSQRENATLDLSARILESLALAIAFANRTQNLSLQPYLELIKLGMSDPTSRVNEVFEYEQPHPILRTWIENGSLGKLPARAPRINPEPEAETRRQQLEDFFTKNREGFQTAFDKYYKMEVSRSPDTLNGPPLWPGMHRQMDNAHEMLIECMKNYRVGVAAADDDPTTQDTMG